MTRRKSILPDEVTTEQLAVLLGFSARSVREWASRGVIVRGEKPGRYLTLESIRNYVAVLQKDVDEASTSASRVLAEEKAKNARIVRQIKLIQLAKLESGILTLDELDNAWAQFSADLNNAILSVPREARAAIPHLTEHDERTMMRVVGDMLVDLAKRAEDMPGVKDTKEFGVLPDD